MGRGGGGRVAASSLDLINIITGFKLTGSKGVRRATGLSVTIFVSGGSRGEAQGAHALLFC